MGSVTNACTASTKRDTTERKANGATTHRKVSSQDAMTFVLHRNGLGIQGAALLRASGASWNLSVMAWWTQPMGPIMSPPLVPWGPRSPELEAL